MKDDSWETDRLKIFEDKTDYIVICELPLEIENTEDGSMATGLCANQIIDGYWRSI